jgi:hypothetical protein
VIRYLEVHKQVHNIIPKPHETCHQNTRKHVMHLKHIDEYVHTRYNKRESGKRNKNENDIPSMHVSQSPMKDIPATQVVINSNGDKESNACRKKVVYAEHVYEDIEKEEIEEEGRGTDERIFYESPQRKVERELSATNTYFHVRECTCIAQRRLVAIDCSKYTQK